MTPKQGGLICSIALLLVCCMKEEQGKVEQNNQCGGYCFSARNGISVKSTWKWDALNRKLPENIWSLAFGDNELVAVNGTNAIWIFLKNSEVIDLKAAFYEGEKVFLNRITPKSKNEYFVSWRTELDSNSIWKLGIWNMQKGEVKHIPTNTEPSSMVFSPVENRLFYLGRYESLIQYDLKAGKEIKIKNGVFRGLFADRKKEYFLMKKISSPKKAIQSDLYLYQRTGQLKKLIGASWDNPAGIGLCGETYSYDPLCSTTFGVRSISKGGISKILLDRKIEFFQAEGDEFFILYKNKRKIIAKWGTLKCRIYGY